MYTLRLSNTKRNKELQLIGRFYLEHTICNIYVKKNN